MVKKKIRKVLEIPDEKKYDVHIPKSLPKSIVSVKYIPQEKKTPKVEPTKLEKLSEPVSVEEPDRSGRPLEDTVAAEPGPHVSEAEVRAYESHLAAKPMPELYNRIRNLYEDIKESGTMDADQSDQLYHLRNAIQQKEKDIERGRYAASQAVAKQLSLAEKIVDDLLGSYRR